MDIEYPVHLNTNCDSISWIFTQPIYILGVVDIDTL